MTGLILKRASASRPSGEWNDDDYDLLADDVVVGRIMKAAAAPLGTPWLKVAYLVLGDTPHIRMVARTPARIASTLVQDSGDLLRRPPSISAPPGFESSALG